VDTRRSFHRELETIRGDLLRLAALVCEAIPRGTAALLEGDTQAAQALIDADAELDRIALDVEDRCYHQLALQQPMASDLRALVTAIRMTSELERSGDLMANVAKGARRIHGLSIDPRTRGLLQAMGDEAARLLRFAIDAYAEADEEKAAAVDVLDDVLDRLHVDFLTQVLTSSRAGTLDMQAAIQLALIGRFYERIGDHAVNVGEKVRYLVSGWLPQPRPAGRVPT
jgi:phosphate transport system protein